MSHDVLFFGKRANTHLSHSCLENGTRQRSTYHGRLIGNRMWPIKMAATTLTSNDFEGHSQVARLFKCNPSKMCAAFYTISTHSVLAVPVR